MKTAEQIAKLPLTKDQAQAHAARIGGSYEQRIIQGEGVQWCVFDKQGNRVTDFGAPAGVQGRSGVQRRR